MFARCSFLQHGVVGEELIEVDAVAKFRRLEIVIQEFHVVVGEDAV